MTTRLYNRLLEGEYTIDELTEYTGKSKSQISRELNKYSKRGMVTSVEVFKPGRGAPKRLYRATISVKEYLEKGEVGIRLVPWLRSIDPETIADIDLYATTLTAYFIGVSKKTSIVNNIGQDLAGIFAYILRNKIVPVGDYMPEYPQKQLLDMENYLLGLAAFCSQLRNDSTYWNRQSNLDQVDISNPKVLTAIEAAYQEYQNGIHE